MGLLEDITAMAVRPAAAPPLPRLRPRGAQLGPAAPVDASPRIIVTGGAKSNIGGEPLDVQPVTPAGTSIDGSDPYADVPRIQPRTGIRRYGFNAASGIASVPQDASPISAFADAYLGAQKSEADQTQAERTRQIDDINRTIELQKAQREAARQAQNDVIDNAEQTARTRVYNAQADNGGFSKGVGLDDAKYYDLLIRKETELNQKYGLNNPNFSVSDPRRAAAQASVAKEMEAYREQLDASMGKTPAEKSGGVDDPVPYSHPNTVDELRSATDPNGAAPAAKTRGLIKDTPLVSEEKTPKGAIPDNITGDGTLAHPFRVRDTRDPTLKSKILVGDHFVWLNPKTGKEEIRVRDR